MDGCPVIEAGNKKDFDLQIAKLEASSVSCDAVIWKIPEGAEYVEGRKFIKDNRLRGVIIPDSVTEIRSFAFTDCENLQTIVILDSVTEIGRYAFAGCISLQTLFIPASVTEIDIHAFSGCICLRSIVVDKKNPVYDSRNNCNAIYKTASNELLYSCINTVDPDSIK